MVTILIFVHLHESFGKDIETQFQTFLWRRFSETIIDGIFSIMWVMRVPITILGWRSDDADLSPICFDNR